MDLCHDTLGFGSKADIPQPHELSYFGAGLP